ncbi:MAG: hypothetical protein JWM80_6305, partial [Cyanobacteria bacterium RYN_339]|nr:hypothetical protein [Cyanobacteria bacterium RYN_339]
ASITAVNTSQTPTNTGIDHLVTAAPSKAADAALSATNF